MSPRREHRLVFLLNVAQRRLQRWMAARTQASGVTAAQSGLLFILGQRDGVLMGEAGAALDLGPPGISGLVDRMTAANLIKRRADPDDGRAWRHRLTTADRADMAQSKAEPAEANARLTQCLTEAQLDVAARWLTHKPTSFH